MGPGPFSGAFTVSFREIFETTTFQSYRTTQDTEFMQLNRSLPRVDGFGLFVEGEGAWQWCGVVLQKDGWILGPSTHQTKHTYLGQQPKPHSSNSLLGPLKDNTKNLKRKK